MIVTKVISGGQTGGDQGGLGAALALGIPTGGWAPRGWRTQAGAAPWLAQLGLVEDSSAAYPPRTLKNVLHSDGTLFFGDATSPGGRLTLKYCREQGKPCMAVLWPDLPQTAAGKRAVDMIAPFQRWLIKNNIRTLNVAGNREESSPGIYRAVGAFLILALRETK